MFCAVNGIQLYYEVQGHGSPLLLVHGNGESHAIFDKAVPLLAKTHTVYTVDSRCHGQSTRTDTLHYADMAQDLIQFIRTMGLEKTIFYGFSDGGILGLLIALAEPELLGKMILSGANLNPDGLKAGTLLVCRLVALTGNPLYRLMVTEPNIAPSQLAQITVPAVVLAGEKDVIRRAHTETIADHIPHSQLEILPGETHGSYIVHSEKLAAVLQPYL